MKDEGQWIADVRAVSSTALEIGWRDGQRDTVELAGWVARGGELLAPLRDPKVFERAAVALHGAAVTWDDEKGDLAIDADHLVLIAGQQRPFGSAELAEAQERLDLSIAEAAELVGVSKRTWSTYRSGEAAVPKAVAIAFRAAMADPVVLAAHLRPRVAGRPRKQV